MYRSVKGTPNLLRPGAFAALAVLLSICVRLSAAAELTGAEAPDFVLKSTAGENLRLSEYRGEIVMLSFWATWCGDCRAQLERLGAMHDHYRDAGVTLLAVSLDQKARAAADGARALDARYSVLHDAGGDVARLYAVDRMPLVLLIDRAGIVRDVFQGYRRGDEMEYLKRLQALLRE